MASRMRKKKKKKKEEVLIEIHRVGIFDSIKSRAFPRIYQLIGPSRRSLSREHHPERENYSPRRRRDLAARRGRDAPVIDGL